MMIRRQCYHCLPAVAAAAADDDDDDVLMVMQKLVIMQFDGPTPRGHLVV